MDVIEKTEKTEAIGNDFLVWLWFKSETQGGTFETGNDLKAEIVIDGRMTLTTDETGDSVTCSCINPLMKEARLALLENKRLKKATFRLTINEEDSFSFSLDSRWMNFRGFKTPKVIQDLKDDSEGFFYEKTGLIEKAVMTMDSVFMNFIRLRISPEWEASELPAIIEWIRKGNNN